MCLSPASSAAARSEKTGTTLSAPVSANTLRGPERVMTAPSQPPRASARPLARTSARAPAASQNTVVLKSATTRQAPWFSTASSVSLTSGTLTRSISAGSVTTAHPLRYRTGSE